MRAYFMVSVASVAVGMFLATKFLKPEAIVTEKVVTRDRVVTKTVTVTAKDGSSTTVTESTQDKQSSASKAVVSKKNWNVAAYTFGVQSYGISVQRRILGDIYAYGSAQTNGQLAVGLGFAF
jgi:hypothetical protein